ncbi:MAG: TraC family protein [Candidatus Levyibacteriota bacterium]
MSKSKNKVSSRCQIDIKEVKDDILVLPKNRYRLILESSSINFELKSEAEQDIITDNFKTFLNSLPFPLQILIRVREIKIDNYLEKLQQKRRDEKEHIYKDQINNYGEFIKKLVSGNKILSRKFYLVIPFEPTERHKDFPFIKEQLYLRRDIVIRALDKIGMKAKQLNSLQILDLFYSFYNQNQIKTQELKGHTIDVLINNNYDTLI